MQFQSKNYNFLSVAGQQAGQGIQSFNEQVKQQDLIKLDDSQAKAAYSEIITTVKDQWKQATGRDDEVAATAFATKYVLPKFKSETASQAAQRWVSVGSSLEKALNGLKTERDKSSAIDVGKKISGGYGAEVYEAVQQGKMSIPDIQSKYGVTLDQDTYNRIAGLQDVQPVVGPFQSPADTRQAMKASAAAVRPMTQEQATTQTKIAQPMPYSKAVQTLAGAGLSKESTETIQPIMNSVANRSTAEAYNSLQKPTEAGFLTTKLSQGEPIDEGAKAMAAAIRNETAQDQKDKYNKMRKFEQQVSLLKVYMQDWKNRKDFEREYGKDAAKAVEQMHELIQKKLEIENQITQAQNWTDMDKPAPDVIKLQEMARRYDDHIDQLRSKIPDIQSMAENLGRGPTPLQPPEVITPPPGPVVPKKTGARKPLSAFEK